MYVTEADLPRVRAEEAANKAARDGAPFKPGVSVGLQSDAIQPLTLRVLPGECLRITLRNDLPDDEPVSLHLHDSSLRVMATGRPAIATEPSALAAERRHGQPTSGRCPPASPKAPATSTARP